MKTKKIKKAIIAILVFTMMAMYGSVPAAKAASMTHASDTLSTSNPGVAASHTITFTLGTALATNDYIEITFPGGFTGINVGNVTCPASTTESVVLQVVKCTATSAVTAATNTVAISSVTNPTANFYTINLKTKTSGNVEIEKADVMVAVVEAVTVTASVPATLTFTVAGTSSGAVINGVTTTATTSATTTAFGTLLSTATSTVGQDLSVVTNASNGYVVTVQQSGELANAAGAKINSFDNSPDGTGSTTPHAWAQPGGVLGQDNTYGHMGLTSNDSDLAFSGAKFAGLNGTAAMTIMSHNGAADGTTQNKGKAAVAYSVKITALQEAGDYSTTLTYICTPTY